MQLTKLQLPTMSFSNHRNEEINETDEELEAGEQEIDYEGTLDVTIHQMNCLLDEVTGFSVRRNGDGDVIPGSMSTFEADQESIDRAVEAATSATGANRRRRRLPPVRPPRSPRPIHTWDELVQMLPISPIERERQAAEIPSARDLDSGPDPSTSPSAWEPYIEYFLWTCRGNVPLITDHLQAIFGFNPPIDETAVAARLGGVHACRQMTFLRKYLPGETHSLQRAEARGVIYEANISHPDIRMGSQGLELRQLDSGHPEYVQPILPCWAPRSWSREDDAFAALYLGEHPAVFQREYSWTLSDIPSIEFISIRMAQIPHLNLSWAELQAAKDRRDFYVTTFPDNFPNENRAPIPAEWNFF